MDTAPWLQEMTLVKPPPMEELVTTTTINNNNNNNMMSSNTKAQQMMERKATRPQKDQTLACPRCNSTNTKFCYYNNYSLTQPRYFCKSCRRYWTEGGSLRNVPVGGGSRKSKRSSSASASASASMPVTPPNPNPNPNKFVDGGQDLNLAFAHQTLPEFRDFNPNNNNNSSSSSNMMLPTGGINPNPNPNRFGPFTTMMPAAYSSSGFSLQQDFRPSTLNFPLDGINGGYDQNGGRLLFDHQSRVQGGDHPPVFWNGMIGGQGGSW